MNIRQLFFDHLAQTSSAPIALEIDRAEGNYIYSGDKKILDLIGGINVCHIGHRHPEVVQAIKTQADKYLHVMVYGECIQSPQVYYSQALTEYMGYHFESFYFTNSGSEAIECAMKMAKKITHRKKIIAFKKSYHGSTQGALSIMGDGYWQDAFKPLLPNTYSLDYNDYSMLSAIDQDTAAVIIEPIQAEAGINMPDRDWLLALQHQCKKQNTLLIFDENQTAFGRTGYNFAYSKYQIIPDIVVLGKALGAGLPLGAVVADHTTMAAFVDNPVLGHITTFGGHPLSCAAGLAGLKVLSQSSWVADVFAKESILQNTLEHPLIQKLNTCGLWAAIHLKDNATAIDMAQRLLEKNIFTDWFLFAQNALRISPPLSITKEELTLACQQIVATLHEMEERK